MQNACVLDGEWQFLPLADANSGGDSLPAPDQFEAEPILVPGCWNTFPKEIGGDWGAYDCYGYPKAWQEAPAAWYRRTFQVKGKHSAGMTFHLRFDAVLGAATVYVNRQRIGTNRDSFLPFSFDVTSSVKPDAENELLVRVDPPPKKGGLWLQPCGSWFGWHMRGIWQSVHLEARPPQAITDIFAAPSVRNRNLTVEVTIAASVVAENAELRIRVEDAGHLALDLGSTPVRLNQPGEVTTSITRDWPDARLWSPEDPHLYHAVAELLVGGQVVHTAKIRFGFREFWIEGTEFRLNGSPIRLFGDSWHYMGPVQQNPAYARTWYTFAKDVGVNAIRTHAMPYPPFYFDIADEMGMMIIDESAIYGSAGTLAFDEPVFWDNCRDHIRRLVRRDRNHPSIIFWSASNETVWKGGEAVYEPLAALADEAKQLDPTRFVSFDENDSDLGGRSPVHSGHYGTPEHWDRAWKRNKPLIIHEFSALYHGGPEAASSIGGQYVYDNYSGWHAATGLDAAQMFCRLRQMGAASITPWNLNWYCLTPIPEKAIENVPPEVTAGGAPLRRIGDHSITFNYGFQPGEKFPRSMALEILKKCYCRQRLYVVHCTSEGYAGSKGHLTAEIWNDTNTTLDARLTLQIGPDECASSDAIRLGPFERCTVKIAFDLPDVDRLSSFVLTPTLFDGVSKEPLYFEKLRLMVLPSDAVDRELESFHPRRVVVAESDATPTNLGDDVTLVIPRSNTTRPLRAWLVDAKVNEWLQCGGRLVLEADIVDSAFQLAPILRRDPRVFLDRPEPIPAPPGVTQVGLAECIPHHDIAGEHRLFPRPTTGSAYAPCFVGDVAEGLSHSPVVVVGHGRGHVILWGFDGGGPMVDLLRARLSHGDLPGPPDRPVAVVGNRLREAAMLHDAGVCVEDGAYNIIIDAGDAGALDDPRASAASLNERIARGSTVLLDNVMPETVGEWNCRLELDLELHDETWFNAARGKDCELLGLTHYDFCWVLRGEKQAIARFPLARPKVSQMEFALSTGGAGPIVHAETSMVRWEDYQLTAEQHKVAMMLRRLRNLRGRRPLMIEFKRGAGRIIVNQLLLREARGPFRSRALRIWSRMLDALGVARDERVSPLAPRQRRTVDAEGFITDWLVLGPFAGSGGQPLDHSFVDEASLRPADGQSAGGRQWQRLSSAFPHVALNDALRDLPERDRVAYAAVFVYAPQDRSVLLDAPDMIALRCGADGGTKPFLNDKCVGRFDFVRELVLDSDRVDGLPLRKGWNQLVIKLHNPSGPWRFAARLMTSAGEPARELTVALAPTDHV